MRARLNDDVFRISIDYILELLARFARSPISGEKSDIVLSNHNYGRRQIKAKWNNEEFGYFNTITKIANATLCSLFMFWL